MKQSIITILAISSMTICQQIQFKPSRYEHFIQQTIAGLEAKKTTPEKKINKSQDRLAAALKKKSAGITKAQSNQYNTIIDASQTFIEGLNEAHQHVIDQLKTARGESMDIARHPITTAQDEAQRIRRAQLTFSVADLQAQIKESKRAQALLEKQKGRKNPAELSTLNTLLHNWANKREGLEAKLRSEQAALAAVK